MGAPGKWPLPSALFGPAGSHMPAFANPAALRAHPEGRNIFSPPLTPPSPANCPQNRTAFSLQGPRAKTAKTGQPFSAPAFLPQDAKSFGILASQAHRPPQADVSNLAPPGCVVRPGTRKAKELNSRAYSTHAARPPRTLWRGCAPGRTFAENLAPQPCLCHAATVLADTRSRAGKLCPPYPPPYSGRDRLFLLGRGPAARALAGPGVSMGALTPRRQAASVP